MQVERQVLDVTSRTVVIHLPESFVNQRVEVIALTLDDVPGPAPKRRQPHPRLAGQGKTVGDLVAPLVDESDWDCLK